jgi:hypothetical protein
MKTRYFSDRPVRTVDRDAEVSAPVGSSVLSLPAVPRSVRYAGVICWALAILVASVTEPGDAVPRTLFGVGFTVYLHLLAYAALAGAIGYALLSADRRALIVAATLATLYGAVIELFQGMIPYRTMAAADGVINAVGAVLGAALWRVLVPLFGIDRGQRSDR